MAEIHSAAPLDIYCQPKRLPRFKVVPFLFLVAVIKPHFKLRLAPNARAIKLFFLRRAISSMVR